MCSCKVVLMLWKQSKMLAPWRRRGKRRVWQFEFDFLGAKWWYKGKELVEFLEFLKSQHHFSLASCDWSKFWASVNGKELQDKKEEGDAECGCLADFATLILKNSHGILFPCLLVVCFYRKFPKDLDKLFVSLRCLLFSLLARGTLDRASLLKAWHQWQVGNLWSQGFVWFQKKHVFQGCFGKIEGNSVQI